MEALSYKKLQCTPRQMRFLLCGDPKPLQRPRFSGRHVYDNQRTLKISLSSEMADQMGDEKMFEKAIAVDFIFFMPMPQRSKSRAGKYHTFKPDLSNLIKLVEDAANGIIFTDDCIIAVITAKKIYDDTSRTEFVVTELL